MPGQMRQSIWQGAGPQPLQGAANAASCARASAYPLETYQTPILDLTKTYSGIELVPARPGYVATPRSRVWTVISVSGTQTSPATYNAGSNTGLESSTAEPASIHDNFMPQANALPTNATINSGTTPPFVTNATSAANNLQLFANAPVLLDISVPAAGTGGFKLLMMLTVTVEWIALEVGQ